MTVMRKAFRWLVSVPEGPREVGDVILWWELRRIPYNLIVGGLGLVGLVLFFFFICNCGVLEPGEDAVEPMAVIMAPVLVNIAYTGGWVVEVFWSLVRRRESRKVGPVLMMLGLAFSVAVVFLPAAVWGVVWAWRMVGG